MLPLGNKLNFVRLAKSKERKKSERIEIQKAE